MKDPTRALQNVFETKISYRCVPVVMTKADVDMVRLMVPDIFPGIYSSTVNDHLDEIHNFDLMYVR